MCSPKAPQDTTSSLPAHRCMLLLQQSPASPRQPAYPCEVGEAGNSASLPSLQIHSTSFQRRWLERTEPSDGAQGNVQLLHWNWAWTLGRTCRETFGNHTLVRAPIVNFPQGIPLPDAKACPSTYQSIPLDLMEKCHLLVSEFPSQGPSLK